MGLRSGVVNAALHNDLFISRPAALRMSQVLRAVCYAASCIKGLGRSLASLSAGLKSNLVSHVTHFRIIHLV
uniref:Uncharacterized protein n=1 Tax=Candidatus Kentrum sp. TUN TaxID=2126343 RepID=A0A451AIJ4_9GAMM|nr:MAG: hypothetical protein BECKTUN1418F_GA0071002_11191 [Candidatus Kentron sp. TUN]VFK60042.1 MAG: hypothetical protein BECKTUN1418D_GA0071000_111310 [Candidatus Kentron sp. TUN]VFK65868.1 MAG: hypothetical protein BECKTUN1418E_GA0071001_11151 [Candidatus Kentron sp. TUN]